MEGEVKREGKTGDQACRELLAFRFFYKLRLLVSLVDGRNMSI